MVQDTYVKACELTRQSERHNSALQASSASDCGATYGLMRLAGRLLAPCV